MKKILLYLSVKYNGDFQKILKALQEKEPVDKEKANEVEKELFEKGYKYTTIISEDYPNELKFINCPPFVIYYKGNLNLLNENSKKPLINIVGTRNSDFYGERTVQNITRNLIKDKCTIVTGNEVGIEKTTYCSVCDKKGNLVLVLNRGIDHVANKELFELIENSNSYLVLSEYPNRVTDNDYTSAKSKRIAVGLSDKVLVAQSDVMSKCHISVNYADEVGKDVFVVPTAYGNSYKGNNILISQGAKILISVEDLVD